MRKWLSWCASLVIAAGILCLCAGLSDGRKLTAQATGETPAEAAGEKQAVVLLGDSVLGNRQSGLGVHDYLEEYLGMPVLNGAFGGSYASYNEEVVYPADVAGQLSLAKLSRAIVSSDFGVQKAQIAYGDRYYDIVRQILEYFEPTIEALEAVDFEKVKYLVIEHGTNDYNRGVALDDLQDRYNEKTFGGALRCAIERFQKAYPQLQMILMTPTWCYVTAQEGFLYCEETDFGGGYLKEYAELVRQIAGEYELPVFDSYQESGINRETAAVYLYDGLHPSMEGQKLLAGKLAELIAELESDRK